MSPRFGDESRYESLSTRMRSPFSRVLFIDSPSTDTGEITKVRINTTTPMMTAMSSAPHKNFLIDFFIAPFLLFFVSFAKLFLLFLKKFSATDFFFPAILKRAKNYFLSRIVIFFFYFPMPSNFFFWARFFRSAFGFCGRKLFFWRRFGRRFFSFGFFCGRRIGFLTRGF